ncbi:MAG TPA: hypothetical protein VLT47_13215 [Anaeromyxobacteraceae bacterium]|nr:hypothetical protein [Anaeromyxobacteraceae bacterium]
MVLIGGQAVNFWAEHYASRVPALKAEAPFTSGDLDFVGAASLEEASRLALALKGTVRRPPQRHYDRSVIAAQVTYSDSSGDERDIQFLRRMCGMDVNEVIRTSIPIRPGLRVMHPVACLESRIHNIVELPQEYDTEAGRQQARVAILCGREFLRDALDAGEVETVHGFNQRIFRFARDHARRCAASGLQPFDAVVVDPRLPEAFRTRDYPRMQRSMEHALHRGGRDGRGGVER